MPSNFPETSLWLLGTQIALRGPCSLVLRKVPRTSCYRRDCRQAVPGRPTHAGAHSGWGCGLWALNSLPSRPLGFAVGIALRKVHSENSLLLQTQMRCQPAGLLRGWVRPTGPSLAGPESFVPSEKGGLPGCPVTVSVTLLCPRCLCRLCPE